MCASRVVAVQGPLLSNWGDDESPGENRRLAVRLEHDTCFLGGGLIQMDGGDVPRYLVPVSSTPATTFSPPARRPRR